MNEQVSAKWLALQGIAIFGSILLAFSIEAWWSDRQETEEVGRILKALETETRANFNEIEWIKGYRAAVKESCQRVLSASPDTMSPEEFDALVADLLWIKRVEFSTGALTSLIDGGKLSIVDDAELSLQISRVAEHLALAKLVEDMEQKVTRDELQPFLFKNSSFVQLSNVTVQRGIPGGADWGEMTKLPSRSSRDHRPLLLDDEFLGMVVTKSWAQDDTLYTYDRLESSMQNLMERLISRS